MKKTKAFSMVELTIVAFLLATTIVLCIPAISNNTKEAKIISAWKRNYAELQSNFEVFNISDKENIEGVCKDETNNDKEEKIFKIIGPYLNVDITKDTNSLKYYHYKFQNGGQISMQSTMFTKRFAYQENDNIVGFKWLDCTCSEHVPCAVSVFDMNGTKAPNRLGEDVFGIYIFKNRIEAFGADYTTEDIEKNCNGQSTGMSCSEYYLRGGKF